MTQALADERPPLLSPKFHPPLRRESFVRRWRLHERLSGASSTPVTLVSAPAGCGKTALVADWLTDLPDDRWAWLSLDSRDNDVVRFWSYFVEALRGLAGPVGEAALTELVRSGGQAPVERWQDSLLNDLVAVEAPTSYLVVDDLHAVTNLQIRESVSRFVANMPSWLRLIIVTRADPPLPLARLRVERRLIEIRQSDLRFDISEASTLLDSARLDGLSDEQLRWLVERTEGWAAGLQLAVIVLGDQPEPDRLRLVSGSNRTFADYIVSEVVDLASDEMRTFLFATSVLERISPLLARAVSGLDDAELMLRDAQARGLFIVALDDRGEWYRFHALFAEAIHAEARARVPDLVNAANECAARWFEERGDLVMALDHWIAAARPGEALRVAVPASFGLIDTGQDMTIERIIGQIPASAVGSDPNHQLDYAILLHSSDALAARRWAYEAERTLVALDVSDPPLNRRCHTVRAVCDLLLGEWDDALVHAAASIDPRGAGVGDSEADRRAGLQLMRAQAWLELTDEAEQIFRQYLHNRWSSPAVKSVNAPCLWALAAAIGGRIREADHWCSRATEASRDLTISPAAYLELLLARAIVHREHGSPDAARAAIEQLRSAKMSTYHSIRTMAEVELALVCIGEGRLTDAADLLAGAEQVSSAMVLGPRVHDAVARAWTDLHVAMNDVARARQAARHMHAGFWREVTLGKLLLTSHDNEAAATILGPLSPTSPRQEVTLRLLRSRAWADSDPTASRAELEAALMTASTEGMLQAVLAAVPGITDLESLGPIAPREWVEDLRILGGADGRRQPAAGRTVALRDQPTERERAVARYLASRLTVPEIARELGISPNTLKTHVSALYRKLGVASREEAVAAARRLGIMG